jgi:hypothetical protein
MKHVRYGLIALMMSVVAYGAGAVTGAVEATITKVDATGKKVTVKTADGTEHTFKVVGHTVVHGSEATGDMAKGSLQGLAEGGKVVVHYSKKGTEETAEEIDKIGEGGLKETKGTITKLDRAGKKIVVKGDDGVEHTYDLSKDATKDAGKDIAAGTEKGTKVTVYYTEKGGKEVAHFFKSAF